MEKREVLIDRIKGYAILLVVLGHAVQYGSYGDFRNVVFCFIYAFHMPLFMFISGYVSNPDGSKQWALRKLKQLLIPFESYACLYCLKYLFQYKSVYESVKLFFYLQLFPNNGGLWFVYVLLVLQLILNGVCKIVDKKYQRRVIVILILCCIISSYYYESWYIFSIKYVIINGLYFFMGYLSKGRKYVTVKRVDSKCVLLLVVEFFFLLTFRFGDTPIVFDKLISIDNKLFIKNLLLLYNWITPIVGIDFSIRLISLFRRYSTANKYLEKMGRKTLYVYYIHTLFIIELANILKRTVNCSETIMIILLFTLSLIITLVIIYLIDDKYLLNKLLFGKEKTKEKLV